MANFGVYMTIDNREGDFELEKVDEMLDDSAWEKSPPEKIGFEVVNLHVRDIVPSVGGRGSVTYAYKNPRGIEKKMTFYGSCPVGSSNGYSGPGLQGGSPHGHPLRLHFTL